MITEREVRAVLDEIVDPCSANAGMPAGLDTMGLVREVAFVDGGRGGVRVELVLMVTEPSCMMSAPFAQRADERVRMLPGVTDVVVTFDNTRVWTPDDLDPEYRHRRAEAYEAALVRIGKSRPAAS